MPITIVVGGQFGSEGKGKVTLYFAEKQKASVVVRVGGPNSGHTIIDQYGDKHVFQQLPVTCMDTSITSVIPAGSYIDLEILEKELTIYRSPNIIIDPHAVIIQKQYKVTEKVFLSKIGSTCSGTGQALKKRIDRNDSDAVVFAKDVPFLSKYIFNTKQYIRDKLSDGERVIIEGTQGYGLSVLHGDGYPYVTSRDTTAAGFLSEAGASPINVDEIVMVIRSCPIRVGGTSGHLPQETTWEKIYDSMDSDTIGSRDEFFEISSVTKKKRRVAYFNPLVVKGAIVANNPTKIVLNHMDYFPKGKASNFINFVEEGIGRNVDYIGIGPCTNDIIDLGSAKGRKRWL